MTEPVQKTLDPKRAYDQWLMQERLPVYGGYFVEDLATVPVATWNRRSARGAYINLEGTGNTNDCYVCEIPPGASVQPQRHMYEEVIYILSGRGATTVWQEGSSRQTFEWHAGSLFAVPLNAWHEHHNGQGDRPVRYVAVTNLPLVLDLFHSLDFIYNNPFQFTDRFAGEAGYFGAEPKSLVGRFMETNFVSDLPNLKLIEWKERGAGGTNIMFEIAGNTMIAHVSEFPVGTYKKAHRHGPGAHVVILSGKGYTLMWPEGGERIRIDWKPGSMLVPPLMWFHQHFNAGGTPARYLAMRWGSRKYPMYGLAWNQEKVDKSLRAGGDQIEYEDETPEIRRVYDAELARVGVQSKMPAVARSA